MIVIPECIECIHIERGRKGWFCKAFPDGVPEAILEGYASHDEPYPGDGGIRFEHDPDWAKRTPDDPTVNRKSILLGN